MGPGPTVPLVHANNHPNVQEMVRAYYTGWYTTGWYTEFGIDLLPGLDQRPDAYVRVTTAADLA